MEIRNEQPGDETAIAQVIESAFATARHANGAEAQIVERLRDARAMTVSLVAVEEGQIVGHIAFSPVVIGQQYLDWYGLGPVAVLPDRQRTGIGSALIGEGLARLRQKGAAGCVLVGEPDYYGRFDFTPDDRLKFPGVAPEYFQTLTFTGDIPSGTVAYHPAFG